MWERLSSRDLSEAKLQKSRLESRSHRGVVKIADQEKKQCDGDVFRY